MRRHIVAGPGVLELDIEGYVADRLECKDEPVPELDGPRDDGCFIELGCGTRVRLGDCPWSDRVQAASEALRDQGHGDPLEPVQVAQRLLEQVIELAESPVTLAELGGGSVVQLATAVLGRYERAEALGPLDDFDELDPDDVESEQVRMVLALHRSLGRGRLPPPHTPPRCDRPKPRWPPQSLPPMPPLLIAPLGSTFEPAPTPSVVVPLPASATDH